MPRAEALQIARETLERAERERTSEAEAECAETLPTLGWQLAINNDLEDPVFLRLYGAALAKAECAVLLSKALTASGLTHEKAAGRVGWTKPAITNLLTGDANPRVGRVGEVLAALGYQMRMAIVPLKGGEDD